MNAKSWRAIPVAPLIAALTVLPLCGRCPAEPGAPSDASTSKFRVDLVQIPLSDLCAVLEKRSGTVHRAADRQTADLLVSAVGELTPEQLRQAVGDVLGVEWRRGGEDGNARYLVVRTPSSIAEAARVQAEADRAFRRNLAALAQMAALPDHEYEQLPPSWMKSQLSSPTNRQAARLLGALTPYQQEQLLSGWGVGEPFTGLSPAGQAGVVELQQGLEDSRGQSLDPAANGWMVRVRHAPESGAPGRSQLWLRLSSPDQQKGFAVAVFVPLPQPDRGRRDPHRLTGAGPVPEGPVADLPLPPSYQVRGETWEEALRHLERTLGRPIVSDAYAPGELWAGAPPASQWESLESYLDGSCRAGWYRRWGRVDHVLTFQRRDWALQRRTQIPASQMARWRRHIIVTGRLSTDHLLEMAALPAHQLPALKQLTGPVWQAAGSPEELVTDYQYLLGLWLRMPPRTRKQVEESGVRVADLPHRIQPLARSIVAMTLRAREPLVMTQARLRVERSPDAWVFSVAVPGQQAAQWTVRLTVPPHAVERLRAEERKRIEAFATAMEGDAGR